MQSHCTSSSPHNPFPLNARSNSAWNRCSASRHLEAGCTLAEQRGILGYANIATTGRYSHANARRMQEMVKGL
jgi:hypothetical protein